MGDTASLTLKVETSSLENATTKLDNFKNKAGEAEKATDDLSGAQSSAQKEIDNLNQTIDSIYKSVEKYRKKLSDTSQETGKAASKSTELYQSYQKQIAGIKDLSTYEKEFESVRKSLRKELKQGNLELNEYVSLTQQSAAQQKLLVTEDIASTAAKQKFIKALKEQVTIQNMSKEQLLRYKAAQLGVSSSADIYIKKLTQANTATKKAGDVAKTSKVQIATIYSQLMNGNVKGLQASSISMLTKGGLGSSLSSLLTLISPVNLGIMGLVAGGGLLAKAYYDGSKQVSELNKTIILTGNYAGVTASQLVTSAKKISSEVGFTSDATEALQVALSKNKFKGNGLDEVAKTAVYLKTAVGRGVDDTVNEFVKLANDPVKASEELNKEYNYLTSSVYAQISALQQQGREYDAQQLAISTYASAMQEKAKQITTNLGWIEQAWENIKKSSSFVIDTAQSLGREDTIDEQIAKYDDLIRTTTNAREAMAKLFSFLRFRSENSYNEQISEYSADRAILLLKKDLQEKEAKHKQEIARLTELDISAQSMINSEIEKRLTKEQALEKVEKRVNELIAARGNLVLLDQKEPKDKQTGIKNYTDKEISLLYNAEENKYSILSSERKSEASTLLNLSKQQEISLNSQLKSLKNQELTTKTITSERKKYYDLQAQIKVIENISEKDKLSAQDKYILANKESLLTQYAKNAAIADEIAQYDSATKALRKMTEYTAQLKADTKASIETFGMTSKESSRYTQLSNLDAQKDIALSFTSNPNDIAKITQEYNTAKAQLEASWTTEDLNQSNWVAGLNSGLNQYAETAQDVFSAANNFAQQSMGSMTNMMTTLVTTGKASFSDFAKSMLTNLVQIINQLLVAQAVQAAMGWMGYSSGGHVNSSAKPAIRRAKSFDSGGFTGSGGKFDPAGIVHKGEFVITKEATQRIGVDNLYALQRAATKGYAGGGLVSGSMPTGTLNNLKSSSQSNQSVIVYSNVTVNNQSSTSSEQSSSQNDAVSKAYQQVVQQGIKTGISKELKQGGLIWQAMQSR